MSTLNSGKLASLAKDLAKDYPRSPRELLAGYIIGMRTLDKCRAALNNSLGEYHFNCPLDGMFFEFTGITTDQFKDFVATGANDEEVAAWVQEHAKPRERIEVIKWNNDLRYKRLSEMDDGIKKIWKITFRSLCPSTFSTTSTTSSISMMPKKKGWRRKRARRADLYLRVVDPFKRRSSRKGETGLRLQFVAR
jgi:Domain of unknown function (DUF5069)